MKTLSYEEFSSSILYTLRPNTSSKNVVLSLAFQACLPAFPLHDLLHIIIDHLQPNILASRPPTFFSTH